MPTSMQTFLNSNTIQLHTSEKTEKTDSERVFLLLEKYILRIKRDAKTSLSIFFD